MTYVKMMSMKINEIAYKRLKNKSEKHSKKRLGNNKSDSF